MYALEFICISLYILHIHVLIHTHVHILIHIHLHLTCTCPSPFLLLKIQSKIFIDSDFLSKLSQTTNEILSDLRPHKYHTVQRLQTMQNTSMRRGGGRSCSSPSTRTASAVRRATISMSLPFMASLGRARPTPWTARRTRRCWHRLSCVCQPSRELPP